ncbi:MAG: heavy-metal-associated domain-containing protein, partial [Mycobacterium sp.]|nr:heavy-metal-associated domain-containing protein [Mycobacterium sp.]
MSAIELSIGGMTCASCAARIEKKLNRIDGVSATVNFATEKAKVAFPDTVTPDDLVAAVEATGYTAALPPAAHDTPPEQEPTEPDDAAAWRQRLVV